MLVLAATSCSGGGAPSGEASPSSIGAGEESPAEQNEPAGTPAGAAVSIDECEPLPLLPCALQVAVLSRPIAGTDLALVYASDRVSGHVDGQGRLATQQGLAGGWTVSAVHGYSVERGELLLGDGSRRTIAAIELDDGRLIVASETGGEVYEFDSVGRHRRTFDALTGFVTLAVRWSTVGVEEVYDRTGLVVEVDRNTDRGVVALTSRTGAVTALGLDDNGFLNQVASADGTTAWVASTGDGLIERLVVPAGESNFRYDADGRLVGADLPDGPSITFNRAEVEGRVEVTTSVGGASTIDTFDPDPDGGGRRTHTDVVGAISAVDIEAPGDRSFAAPDGTSFDVELGPDPRWGLQAPVLETVTVSAPDVSTTVHEARESTSTDPDPVVGAEATRSFTTPEATTTLTFEPAARVVRLVRDDRTDEWTFDERGRVVSLRPSGRAATTYGYATDGALLEIRQGSGADQRVWSYERDAANGTSTVTTPDGSATTIRYDAASRPASMTRSGAPSVNLEYDPAGNLALVEGPGDTSLTSVYNASGVGTLASTAGMGGARYAATTVDSSGRPAVTVWSDGIAVATERDQAGRLVTSGDGEIAYEVSYDAISRPDGLIGDDVTVSPAWTAGALTGLEWSGAVTGSVAWLLDTEGRVATETVEGTDTVSIARDPLGRVTGLGALDLDLDDAGQITSESIGGVAIAREHNQFGEVTDISATIDGSPLFREVIGRDRAGRVEWVTVETGEGTSATTYRYDANRNLEAVDAATGTQTFGYDADGNRTSIADSAGTTAAATFDPGDALLSLGDATYSVDAAGRLTSRTGPEGTTTYDYDRTGELQSVRLPDQRTVDYTVDASGRRVGRTVDGTFVGGYLYGIGPAPVAELDSDGNVTNRIVYRPDMTTPAYLERDGRTFAYVVDHLGSPRLLVDVDNGQIAQQLDYDVWGRVVADTNPGFQPLGFTGGLLDPPTGLVHLGRRDYDPIAGRFTAPDPIGLAGGSTNLYQYAGNQPTTYRDPTGTCIDCPVYTAGGSGYIGILGAGAGGSVSIVYVPGEGVIVVASGGAGGGNPTGVGIGVQGGRMDPVTPGTNVTPSSVLGSGATGDVAIGPINFGPDVSYDSSGRPSLQGEHYGVGPSIGAPFAVSDIPQTTVCILFCPPPPGPPPDPCSGAAPPVDCLPLDEPDPCSGAAPPVDCLPLDEPDPCTGAAPPVECLPLEEPDPCGGLAPPLGCLPLDQPDPCAGPNPPTPCAPTPCDDTSGNRRQCEDPEDPFDPNAPGTFGDPHLITLGGDHYDFQAAGEFVLLQSDERDLVVQVRQEPLINPGSISLTTAVALAIGTDRVGIYAGRADGELWLNGVPIIPGGGTVLPGGGTIRSLSWGYEIRWPDGDALQALVSRRRINLSFQPAPSRGTDLHGLIGPSDGSTGSLEGRDGTRYAIGELADSAVLYGAFGSSWLLTAEESLFDYDDDRSTESYFLADFPIVGTPLSPEQLAAAEAVCRAAGAPEELLTECAFDVASTGDASYATALSSAQASIRSNTPPPPETTDDRGSIEPGAIVASTISTAGESDIYHFTVAAGEAAYFASDPACDGSDLEWYVADSSGASITRRPYLCDDIGRVEFAEAGDYQLVVRSYLGSTGSYQVTWNASDDDDRGELALGDWIDGEIVAAGQVHTFDFTVTAGQAIYFGSDESCAGSQLSWHVLDAAGTQVTFDPYLCNDIGRVDFTDGGEYQLVVRSYQGSTGPYRVRGLEIPGTVTDDLVFTRPVTGTIRVPGEQAHFSFTADAGDVIYFDADQSCSGSLLSWHVLDAAGDRITSDPYLCNDIGRITFTEAGTLTLEVGSYAGSTGNFHFAAHRVPDDASTPLTIGERIIGSIQTPGERHRFTFDVDAGDSMSFRADPACTSFSSNLLWSVVDAAATSIVTGRYVCTELEAITFPSGGRYDLVLESNSGSTGAYSIQASDQ